MLQNLEVASKSWFDRCFDISSGVILMIRVQAALEGISLTSCALKFLLFWFTSEKRRIASSQDIEASECCLIFSELLLLRCIFEGNTQRLGRASSYKKVQWQYHETVPWYHMVIPNYISMLLHSHVRSQIFCDGKNVSWGNENYMFCIEHKLSWENTLRLQKNKCFARKNNVSQKNATVLWINANFFGRTHYIYKSTNPHKEKKSFSEERNRFGRKHKCFANSRKLSRENTLHLQKHKCFVRKKSFSEEHNCFGRKRKCFAN